MARKKKSNEDPDQPDNAENTDDTFGLPEIEYEPLKREEAPQAEQAPAYEEEPKRTVYEREEVHNEYTNTYEDEDDDRGSPWPKILGIIALLAIAGGAYWFFARYQPAQREALKAQQEQLAREEAAKAERSRLEAEERTRAEAEQRRADSLANLQTKVGAIETLTERTRRYYVIVASAIDGDLIMDQAQKLSAKGVSSKIIPPFGKAKFYRLAIAEGDTYAATQTTADGMKSEYGDQVWVVRY